MTPALKNLNILHFNRLLLTKVNNVRAEKGIGELCLMELNIYATYEQKLNCTFKNDFSNLANFHQSMFRSLKIGTLIGSFYRKWKMYELKLYRRVSCHDNEEWCWRGIHWSFQNWYEEFVKFWPKHSKISKICHLMEFF